MTKNKIDEIKFSECYLAVPRVEYSVYDYTNKVFIPVPFKDPLDAYKWEEGWAEMFCNCCGARWIDRERASPAYDDGIRVIGAHIELDDDPEREVKHLETKNGPITVEVVVEWLDGPDPEDDEEF